MSVASEISEPLLKCKGPLFEKSPYLARAPSGHISNVMNADELIRKWMGFEISNDAEICSSMGKWIFLLQRLQLFKFYPEFDKPNVRERLDQIAPASAASEIPAEPRVPRRQANTSRNTRNPENAKPRRSAQSQTDNETFPMQTKTIAMVAVTLLAAAAIITFQIAASLRFIKLPIY